MTTSSFNLTKLVEMFKHIKSDAVPRAPRPSEDQNNESSEEPQVQEVDDDEEEEIVIEPEDDIKKKTKKKSSKPKETVHNEEYIKRGKNKCDSSSYVNVQATGNVYNIVNSSGVRLGDDFYFGPVSARSQNKTYKDSRFDEEIVKDNLITLLMEASIRPDHDYIDYISKNLGKDWQTFFRALGFKQGRIETAEYNAKGMDISEARYKLLLDWVNNEDDGSLGRLATLLWEEGERSIVKELSLMYKKSKK